MKLTSPQTYKVLRFALERKSFRQAEASKETGVSLGLVNRVTNWLVAHHYAARQSDGYRLIAPAALAQQFSFFRRMEQLRFASFDVELSQQEVMEVLEETKSVLCLTSALQRYSDYFRDPSLHFYADERVEETLRQLNPGRTRVELYRDDLEQDDDFENLQAKGTKKVRVTKKIRTMIDVLCSQRAYAAERLILHTWK